VKTTSSLTSTSYVLSWSAKSRCTESTLRRLLPVSASFRSRTTSTFREPAIRASAWAASFVDGASLVTSELTTWTRPPRARSESAPRSAAAFIFFGVFCS
jgi:hypothetical protein